VVLVGALVLAGLGYELSLPGVGDAPARVAAIVRSHHGVIGHLPLPTKLATAVVAVEDKHFYSNVFLNVFDGAARAAVASLSTSGDPGGSTIPQQLAKRIYTGPGGFAKTLEQIGLGVKLALDYPRPELLAMYLNAVYFGNGYWGDVAAARGYFGVAPAELTWAEASMLAGLPQAPSAYDPVFHMAKAKLRQHHVLDRLVANHVLTPAQAAAIYRAPLPLRHGGRAASGAGGAATER
jgi:penicillin-binding protein 1A